MSFQSLNGNNRIKHVLRSYIGGGRLPSSMIFSGPGGSHKLEFAMTLAKTIVCQEQKEDCCDSCTHCQAIDRRAFPDVRILEPDGQFYKKAQISELIEAAQKKPMLAAKNVFILMDAHAMNETAANSFLKTLEEPSPANLFILLTTNLGSILPTIQSRCQILKFQPLSHSEIVAELQRRGYPPEWARLLSFVSQSDALGLQQLEWSEVDRIRREILAMLASLVRQVAIEDILLDLTDRSRSRESFLAYFREVIHLISLYLRDIMVLMVDLDSTVLINFDFREQLLELSQRLSIQKVFFLLQRMELLLRDIKRNLNAKVLILEFINSYTVGEEVHG